MSQRVKEFLASSESRQLIHAAALRLSFGMFIREAWELATGHEYVHGRHIELLSTHLEACARGEISRLRVNIPPSCSKSTIISVLWPAWVWASQPDAEFLVVSYSQQLATRDSVACRELIRTNWYRDHFPNISVTDSDDSKLYFALTSGGGRRISTPGATTTGLHPRFIIIDDPLSRDEASSHAIRESVRAWYFETLSTRGIARDVCHIVAHQRLHPEDLSGWIAKHDAELRDQHGSSPWHSVVLPMRFEPECAMGDVGYGGDWRTEPGQLLYPELLDEAKVLSVERALGPSATRAQLQQNPRLADSGILKISKIPVIHRLQLPPLDRMVRAWDLAATEGAGCFTAGVLMGVQRKRSSNAENNAFGPATDRFFVLDSVREQTDDPLELMRRTAMLDARLWGKVDLCFEQQPGGAGVILTRQIRDHLRPYDPKPIPPKGSKTQRAEGFASAIQFGELSSHDGHYLKEYLLELERFPAMPCDQVDASSLAYQALVHTKRQLVVSLEEISTCPAPVERCQSQDCPRPTFQPDGHCCGGCREGTGRHTPDCCLRFTEWYNRKI